MASDSFIGKVSKGNGERPTRTPPPPKPSSQIPILRIVLEALVIPIRHPKFFGASILFFVIIFAIGALAGFSIIETREPGVGSVGLFFGAFFGIFLVILFVGYLFCGLFSYWIRITMLGPEPATKQPIGNWLSQALGVFCYNIIIAIILIALGFFLSFIFLPLGLANVHSGINMKTIFSYGFAAIILSVLITWIYCWIYASFSTNFVKSALGKDIKKLEYDSSLMESDTMRISFILIGLYGLFEIVRLLLNAIGLGGDSILGGILIMVFVIYEVAVFGAAHAISFKVKTKMEEY